MNIQRAVRNLAKALTFPTITEREFDKINADVFLSYLQFVEESYPLIHTKLSKTMINTYAPVFHWKAHESSGKKPLLLIAHYDVVPVADTGWEKNPFGGYFDETRIVGRGAIDDKNSMISILETIETLLERGYEPKRDIYLAFGFDEEVGGKNGATRISEYFKKQGIRFEMVLDEGGVVTEGKTMGILRDIAVVGLAEKGNTSLELTFKGEEGHSSMPPENTSIGKMAALIRDIETHPRKPRLVEPMISMLKAISTHKKGVEAFLLKHPTVFSWPITAAMGKWKHTASMLRSTVAFTMTHSGTAPNVLPKQAHCVANVRVLPGDTVEDVITWMKSFGHEFEVKALNWEEPSRCSKQDTPEYEALKRAIHKVFPGTVITPYLMVGGTDARRYESVAENIYRFSPCRLSSEDLGTMHGTNEFITVQNIEHMLRFYEAFIKELCS